MSFWSGKIVWKIETIRSGKGFLWDFGVYIHIMDRGSKRSTDQELYRSDHEVKA